MLKKPAVVVSPTEPSMTPRRAAWFSWVAFATGLLAAIANQLIGAGLLSPRNVIIAAWVANVCIPVSWYLARRTPNAGHLITARRKEPK